MLYEFAYVIVKFYKNDHLKNKIDKITILN